MGKFIKQHTSRLKPFLGLALLFAALAGGQVLAEAASGLKLNIEKDDKSHPGHFYAEADHAEFYTTTADGGIITMASTAAVQALGNTNATGDDIAASVTAVGMTQSLTAGTLTVAKPGNYRCYYAGYVTGEEDEDVTLEWQKNSTALEEPAEIVIEIDDAGLLPLKQYVSHEFKIALRKNDVMRLTALGSNDEVITFLGFNWGCEQISSLAY